MSKLILNVIKVAILLFAIQVSATSDIMNNGFTRVGLTIVDNVGNVTSKITDVSKTLLLSVSNVTKTMDQGVVDFVKEGAETLKSTLGNPLSKFFNFKSFLTKRDTNQSKLIKTDYPVEAEGDPEPSTAIKVTEANSNKSFDFKTLENVADILSQPLKLAKLISKMYNVQFHRLVKFVGKSIVIGSESIARPIISSIKILEKVFRPDACMLQKICQIGHHLRMLRRNVLLISPGLLEESDFVKAITGGIIGDNCKLVYDNCHLNVKPELKYDYFKESKSSKHEASNKKY